MSSLALPVAARGLDACGFVRRSLIIWDKGHIVIGRGHYHWRHETCWYAVKKQTARAQIEAWRCEYNEERPKKGLGGLTPALYAKQLAAEGSTVTPGL